MKYLIPFVLSFILLATSCKSGGDYSYELGDKFYYEGDLERAVQYYSKAARQTLDVYELVEVYYSLAIVYDDMDDIDKAKEYYQMSIVTDSLYYNAWLGKGNLHKAQKEYDYAEKCYRKVEKILPDDTEVKLYLSDLYLDIQEPDLAIDYLEEVLALDSINAIAYADYAIALAMKGQLQEADEKLSKAEDADYYDMEGLTNTVNDYKAHSRKTTIITH